MSDIVSITSTAPYELGTTPNGVQTVKMSSPGSLRGVPTANAVGSANDPARTVIAAWGSDRVTGGGRLAIVMDINWIAEQYRADNWHLFVENLHRFLAGG